MATALHLPVGSSPGWEVKAGHEGNAKLNAVAKSFVIPYALKQSRTEWLSSVFPKFSAKPRANKPVDVIPPEHRAISLGKCNLAIGPHIFVDTALYEVHYSGAAPLTTPSYPSTSSTGWQPSRPYTSSPYSQYSYNSPSAPPQTQTPSLPSAQTVRATTPLVSSIAPELPRPSTLASLLDDAAASNPTLSNLIRQALSGQANPDQMETLHLLIKSLASGPSALTPPTATTTPMTNTGRPPYVPPAYGAPAYQQPSQGHGYTTVPSYAPAQPTPPPQMQRNYDIILEFKEKTHDRWLFPRGHTACERKPPTGRVEEILISTVLPFPKSAFPPSTLDAALSKKLEAPRQVVTFHLTNVYLTLWDNLVKWCGGLDEMERNRAFLKSIRPPKRVYLQQRLPEGDLLAQLREAATSPYVMRPMKTTYKEKTKAKRPKTDVPDTEKASASKRRRPSQAKPAATPTVPQPKKIACVGCGQADVPLMLGGRFCRTCVDTGKPRQPGSSTSISAGPSRSYTSVATPLPTTSHYSSMTSAGPSAYSASSARNGSTHHGQSPFVVYSHANPPPSCGSAPSK